MESSERSSPVRARSLPCSKETLDAQNPYAAPLGPPCLASFLCSLVWPFVPSASDMSSDVGLQSAGQYSRSGCCPFSLIQPRLAELSDSLVQLLAGRKPET